MHIKGGTAPAGNQHPRLDPWLDLTRLPFAASWWMRVGVLLVLLSFTAYVAVLTPAATRLSYESLRQVNAVQRPADTAPLSSSDIDFAAQLSHLKKETRANLRVRRHARTLDIILSDNETLSDALIRSGFSARISYAALARLNDVYDVRKARPGLQIRTQIFGTTNGALQALDIKTGYATHAVVTRTSTGGFTAQLNTLETQDNQRVVAGAIPDSLYLAAERTNMPPSTILSLIRALSFRVDFQREIRAGDSFRAIYGESEAADGTTQAGDITYAELDLGDRVERLYQFKHPKTKRIDYYDASGESMRRLLMRTPIDGARLTSGFGKRRHPVLGYVKSHKGVDFGAPTGTPIYAAGDGVIERANRYGSYGNYVRIAHARGYKTAYAHLSRFAKNMKPGRRVRQGQVIGYVGATGRVTGAHLHYEVHQGAKKVNPMRLDLPTGEVLSGAALAAFQDHMKRIDTQLESEAPRQEASLESSVAPAAGTSF
ncbi:MAG: peptidoglycan DD-metalloendopeptidase family protein [Pseudomonadota bacterium]